MTLLISKLGLIVKSWQENDVTYIEGWLSTPLRDLEKDVTEPEAFLDSMESYFARRAPLSIEHGTRTIPVGHLQKAAILRNGQVLKAAAHPTDPAEFTQLPDTGTGVWARAAINEEPGISAIRKGNVGGFSFIAQANTYEPLAGGRYRYTRLDPWLESTIAAYPVNSQAIFSVAKAYGIGETPHMTPEEIQALLHKALADRDAEQAERAKKAADQNKITELTNKITDLETKLADAETRVQKALENQPVVRGEGVGRKGTLSSSGNLRDDDPLAYIVEKAKNGHKDLDLYDRDLIAQLTIAAITEGMVQ